MSEEIHKPTYPALLKFFYDMFPDLSLAAHSVGLAILHVLNRTYFQYEWTPISNSEITKLSKVKEGSVWRSRNTLLKKATIRGKPFFEYEGLGKNKAGLYKLNYRLIQQLQNNYNITTEQLQDNYNITTEQLQDNYNITTTDVIKPPVSSHDHNKLTNITNSTLLSEKEKLVCQCFSKACGQLWQPQTDTHTEAVEEIAQIASEEQLETIAQRAVEGGGIQPYRVIGWFRRGIKDWSKYYGKDAADATGLTPVRRDELNRELNKLEGEFALALADESKDWLPEKPRYLCQQFPKINRIRQLLGVELMPESVLEGIGEPD